MILDRLTALFLVVFCLNGFVFTQQDLTAAEGRKLDLKADKAYTHVIEPILVNNCTGCHGADKAKGKIRLHTPEEITKSESIIADGAGDIPMIFRVNLPDDDEEVMRICCLLLLQPLPLFHPFEKVKPVTVGLVV